jgi:hypothetical protein
MLPSTGAIIFAAKAGKIDVIDSYGVERYSIPVKAGISRWRDVAEFVPTGFDIRPDGVEIMEPPSRFGGASAPGMYDVGANPDFVPSSIDRTQRLEGLVGQLIMTNKAMASAMSARARDAMPRPSEVKPADDKTAVTE